MSLHLEFEPHSYYKGFAIRKWNLDGFTPTEKLEFTPWTAYTDNGNTYRIDELNANTLQELKQSITAYHQKIAERDAYNRAQIGE